MIPFSHQTSQSLNLFLPAAEFQSGFLHIYGSGSRSGNVLVFSECWESLQRIVNLLCEICSGSPGFTRLCMHVPHGCSPRVWSQTCVDPDLRTTFVRAVAAAFLAASVTDAGQWQWGQSVLACSRFLQADSGWELRGPWRARQGTVWGLGCCGEWCLL